MSQSGYDFGLMPQPLSVHAASAHPELIMCPGYLVEHKMPEYLKPSE